MQTITKETKKKVDLLISAVCPNFQKIRSKMLFLLT